MVTPVPGSKARFRNPNTPAESAKHEAAHVAAYLAFGLRFTGVELLDDPGAEHRGRVFGGGGQQTTADVAAIISLAGPLVLGQAPQGPDLAQILAAVGEEGLRDERPGSIRHRTALLLRRNEALIEALAAALLRAGRLTHDECVAVALQRRGPHDEDDEDEQRGEGHG